MQIEVQLFAVARELAGSSAVTVELPTGATLGQLREQLAQQYPALAPLARSAMFAVAADYAADSTVLTESSSVACIPPVSGG